MKFLYVGDIHERSTSPRNRKDNWEETTTAKVKEIRELAKKYNVKAILHGGDFFSNYKYDTEFLAKVLNKWGHKNYNEKLLEEGVLIGGTDEAPIITPIGNHDLLGSSLKSYEKTSLCFLESIGFITIANKERPLIFKEDDFTVAITGGHYELDMDETKEPYIVDEKQGDYHIHIVHGMLTDHKWPEGVPHTTLDEVLHTKADLTIAGHDHKGFSKFEHDGKIFVNPGSPVRMGTDEIKRKPKVMLIDVTKDGIDTKYIYLKSAKPGEEVFDLSAKENKERKTNTLKDIKERVKETSKTGASIDSIIKSIAEESEIDEDIVQKAIDRVANKISASKEFNSNNNDDNNQEDYYITSMELINFCSHERTAFNFDKGLNVFIGATASGKTTCFRALKWIYDDEGKSKRFIKKGTNFCEATITTSHGYTITRFIHNKGKKTQDGKTVKNGYEIIHPNGTVEVTNTKGVDVVRDILSYKKLNLENKEIDLNFLKQGASWFFIGDRYTSTDRAKMIGAIHKTHFVDLAIKDLESDTKKLNQKRDDKVEEIANLQKKIDEFSYLEEMKNTLIKINEKKERLVELQEKISKIESIIAKKDAIDLEIKKCDEIINSINQENINKAKKQILNLKQKIDLLERISSSIKKQDLINENIQKEDKIINSISIDNLSLAKEKIETAKKNLNTSSSIKSIIEKEEILIKNINICDNTIKKIDSKSINIAKEKVLVLKGKLSNLEKIKDTLYKRDLILKDVRDMDSKLSKINIDDINKAKASITMLKDKMQQRHNILQILSKRALIEKEVLKTNEQIKNSEEILKSNIETYKTLLELNGKCPICNSKIDSVTARKIAEDKLNK